MRSEGNKSPMQLWINGLNAISASGSTVAQEIFEDGCEEDFQNYGVDWNETAGEIEPDSVEVPSATSGLNADQEAEVRRYVPENVTFGDAINTYVEILNRALTLSTPFQ